MKRKIFTGMKKIQCKVPLVNLKERDRLEDIAIDGIKIFELILN
jgi:hypothetical protein